MDFKKTNATVIKSMFLQMHKKEFIENANAVKTEYLNLVPTFSNKNYEVKLWEIYRFSAIQYQKKWQTN
jgi:hypothetical protein